MDLRSDAAPISLRNERGHTRTCDVWNPVDLDQLVSRGVKKLEPHVGQVDFLETKFPGFLLPRPVNGRSGVWAF